MKYFLIWALDALAAEGITYFPTQLDFEEYKNVPAAVFYDEQLYDLTSAEIALIEEQSNK